MTTAPPTAALISSNQCPHGRRSPLLRKPNGGQSSARNLGIRQATGDLIALLDQDDWWYPDHLAELSKPFRSPDQVRQAADTLALTARCYNWKVRVLMDAFRPVLKTPALGWMALPLVSGLRPIARKMLR